MRRLISRLGIASLLFISLTHGVSFAADRGPQNKLELYLQYGRTPIGPTVTTPDPPPQPAIAVAEWEPATSVLICYPLQIPLELVAAMSEVVEVVTFVKNGFWMQRVARDYLSAGIDTSVCTFVFTGDRNLPYTRDFGPWYVFTNNGEQGFINNEYHFPSIRDGDIPIILGDALGIPVYDTGLRLDREPSLCRRGQSSSFSCGTGCRAAGCGIRTAKSLDCS